MEYILCTWRKNTYVLEDQIVHSRYLRVLIFNVGKCWIDAFYVSCTNWTLLVTDQYFLQGRICGHGILWSKDRERYLRIFFVVANIVCVNI